MTLKKNLENVDLEAVFSVIDGIIHYDIERLGLLSVFASANVFEKDLVNNPFELWF